MAQNQSADSGFCSSVADFGREHQSKIIGIVIALIVGLTIGLFHPTPDEQQRLLRTLATAQASFLAIVVTVGILSIQISASEFGPLVINTIKKKDFIPTFLSLFGVSILLDLTLYLSGDIVPQIDIWLYPLRHDAEISGAFFFATLGFLSLFYIRSAVVDLIEPESLLEAQVEQVNLSSLPNRTELRNGTVKPERHPLLEIYRVVQRSFNQEDEYSTDTALFALREATIKIIEENNASDDNTLDEQLLFQYWEDIVEKVVNNSDRSVRIFLEAQSESCELLAVSENCIGTEPANLLESIAIIAYDQDSWIADLGTIQYKTLNRTLNTTSTTLHTTIIGNLGSIQSHIIQSTTDTEEYDLSDEEEDVITTLQDNFFKCWEQSIRKNSVSSNGIDSVFEKEIASVIDAFPSDSHFEDSSSITCRDLPNQYQKATKVALEEGDRTLASRLVRSILEIYVASRGESNSAKKAIDQIDKKDAGLIGSVKTEFLQDDYSNVIYTVPSVSRDTREELIQELGI